jgi:hypothetical protein
MKYYKKYTYRVRNNSEFRFNEEGELLKEVNIIAKNKVKAFTILETNYPHFRPDEIELYRVEPLKELFK